MAKRASNHLFFFLFSILCLTISSSGTLMGFSYNVTANSASSSPAEVTSFLKLNKVSLTRVRVVVEDHRALSTLFNSGLSVDLYLNQSLVESLLHSESTAVSWLKTHVETFLPHVNIRSIILSCRSENFSAKDVLATLKLVHSVLSRINLNREVKASVAFSLPFLENLNTTHERDLHRIFDFVKKIRSFVTIQASIDEELSIGGQIVESVIKKANTATSTLPRNDIPVIYTINSPVVSSARDVAEFIRKVSKSSENEIHIRSQKAELYAEVSSMADSAPEEQILSSRRELLNNLKTTLHDTYIPPNIPTPTIVTVPATNPVTITPANPDLTPLPIPSTTPVNIPPATPVNPPPTVTNPVTTPSPITVPGAQPITNPVTTYPAPPANVPVTTPVTSPVTPPAQTNAPATPGQSWCVARTGASETSLQLALDYACGIGGADCSPIQQSGSCYNPNTVQNHASYAFNSYYQKNPSPTSCDFGGTAVIVNTNPSTGSCIYPSSSSSSTTTSTPSTPTTPTSTPTTTAPPATTTVPPTTTTTSPVLPGVPGAVTSPAVLNSSSPNSAFGSDSPPVVNTSTSTADRIQRFRGCFTLVTSFFTGMIILNI